MPIYIYGISLLSGSTGMIVYSTADVVGSVLFFYVFLCVLCNGPQCVF